MAAGDFAILTGISWYPNPGFTPLDGPANDLELVRHWLTTVGGVPAANIRKVASPSPMPAPGAFNPDLAPPVLQDFDVEFLKLQRQRKALGAARLANRLYLYFSGHGFCNRSQDRPAEAALYCANASRDFYSHIFGTQYARIAVGQALFKEVVLVMDCCRDSEIAKSPVPPHFTNTPDDALASQVQLLSIYATPKGGKAQERKIAERGGKVYGLLTHALVKLLQELPVTDAHGIPATELRAKLLANWDALCGEEAAPRPEIYLPPSGEIHFPSASQGSPFEFRWKVPPPPGATLTLSNHQMQQVAEFALAGEAPQPQAAGPILSVMRTADALKLRMSQGLYQYKLSAPAREELFKVDGGDRHVEL